MMVKVELDAVDCRVMARDYLRRAQNLLEDTGLPQFAYDQSAIDAKEYIAKALALVKTLSVLERVGAE